MQQAQATIAQLQATVTADKTQANAAAATIGQLNGQVNDAKAAATKAQTDAQQAQTQLQTVQQQLDQSKSAPDAMQRVQDLFREKIAETREQLRRLAALEGELQASLDYLETCDRCDTEELLGACTACARHDCEHKTPDLVAGFRVH